jgi:hypothetical protein
MKSMRKRADILRGQVLDCELEKREEKYDKRHAISIWAGVFRISYHQHHSPPYRERHDHHCAVHALFESADHHHFMQNEEK